MHYFVNKEKYCQICICPVWFYFTILVDAHFCDGIERCQLWKSLKFYIILTPVKNDVRFEYAPWKISDFVSFALFGLTLVIKLRNFNLESHWTTLIFLIKKYVVSNLNMSHEKMSDFVSFLLFGFTLLLKLRNFDFKKSLKYFNIFWSKKMMSYLNMFCQTASDLVLASLFE